MNFEFGLPQYLTKVDKTFQDIGKILAKGRKIQDIGQNLKNKRPKNQSDEYSRSISTFNEIGAKFAIEYKAQFMTLAEVVLEDTGTREQSISINIFPLTGASQYFDSREFDDKKLTNEEFSVKFIDLSKKFKVNAEVKRHFDDLIRKITNGLRTKTLHINEVMYCNILEFLYTLSALSEKDLRELQHMRENCARLLKEYVMQLN